MADTESRAKGETSGGASDPLDTYRRKRDFEQTAEPAGGEAQPRPERPRYLIQKHDATRLHYDLRLEVDGVLKSWAVPKGPSFDPGEKRLAVQTEDHPLEYGSFEGIIPEGQYGGGTVMLWDTGWWEIDREWIEEKGSSKKARTALAEGPAAAIAAGELKFKLHGEKLQGSWVLVQMKGRGDKNWLLIKHRDETAREEGDITEERPDSVVTDRSFAEIEADAEAGDSPVWESESAAGDPGLPPNRTDLAERPPEPVEGEFTLGAKTVEFSHPERVYFPEAGVTKGEILAYYREVAPLLVPHLSGRPLMLERYPQGIDAEHFYQKNVPDFFPDWLETYEYPTDRRVIHHAVVNDAADLLYLANQGTLTFHTFMSRTDDVEHPDLMVIDLDPPKEGAGDEAFRAAFRQAVEAALIIADVFAEHDIELLVKTSGKRGIHLAFPLGGDMTYPDAKAWLDAFLDGVARAHPDRFTRELRKAKREGRLFLEALRMSLGATVVPPYVVRPTAAASVSMPVTWDELPGIEDPRMFTVRTALPRLEETGDLWALVARPSPG